MKIRLIRDKGPWSEANTGKGKFVARLIPHLESLGATIVYDKDTQVDIDMQLGHIHYKPEDCKKFVVRMGPAFVDTNQKYKKLNKPKAEAVRIADGVVYQSQFSKQICDTFLGASNNKTATIHNGAFPSEEPPLESRVEINFCASTRVWLPQKRLKDIVESWLMAGLENARLWIAGDTRGLEKQYRNKSLYWMGHVDNRTLEPLYRLCTTMIHVVYIDACPNAVCEAMVNGCQVLCNDNGGTKELIDSYGRNGRVLPIDTVPYDFKPIYLNKPPTLNREILAKAIRDYAYVEKHRCFETVDIRNIAKQYMTFFEDVLNE